MRFIYDFNNLALMTLHLPAVDAKGLRPNWDMWHYIMFKRVHEFTIETLVAHKQAQAEIFLAEDTQDNTWRHTKYTPYKGNRVKDQNIDWPTVWEKLEDFKQLMQRYLPWHFVKVDGAEADDIVAVLVWEAEAKNCKTVIYSADADYLQLCSPNTFVYRPTHQEFVSFPAQIKIAGTPVRCETPEQFTQLSIMTGQGRKDNVFNIKTNTDWVPTPTKKRMSPFGVKAAMKAYNSGLGMLSYIEKLGCRDNYERNRDLIDFRCIPEEVQAKIKEALAQEAVILHNNDFRGLMEHVEWPSLADMSNTYDDLYKTLFREENKNE